MQVEVAILAQDSRSKFAHSSSMAPFALALVAVAAAKVRLEDDEAVSMQVDEKAASKDAAAHRAVAECKAACAAEVAKCKAEQLGDGFVDEMAEFYIGSAGGMETAEGGQAD